MIEIDHNEKMVFVWGEEDIEKLKIQYSKYTIVEYISGKEDMKEIIKKLIMNNIDKAKCE